MEGQTTKILTDLSTERLGNKVSSDEGQKTHHQICCKKCGRIYLLPINAKSWRCQNKNCHTFNDLQPDWCFIL